MTANPPSFSSFPPSFSSFPDIQAEDDSSKERKDKKRSKRVKDDEQESTRHHSRRRDRSRSKERNSKPNRSHSHRSRSRERSKSHRESDDTHKRRRREDSPSRKSRIIDADYDNLSRKSKHRSKDENAPGNVYDSKSRYDFPDEIIQSTSKLFIEDGKGDEGNIRYGGLHSYAVPKFKRMGYGSVVGVPHGAWKLRSSGTNVELSFKKQVQGPRLSSPKWSSYVKSIQPRRLVQPKYRDQEIEDNSGFIPLPSQRPKQNNELAYRSITTVEGDEESDASSSQSSDDGQLSEGDEEFTAPSTSAFMERNVALTQATKSDPTSTSAWLDLLRHSTSSAPTQQARAEISLSILEKAFEAHYSNKSNPSLLSQHLLSGSQIWSQAKLRDEWEASLKKIEARRQVLLEQTTLWMDYLTFKLKDGGIEGLEQGAARVWKAVGRQEGVGSFELECFNLRVLWRCCVGLSEAGYSERAVATFQSQIELTIFAPSGDESQPFSQLLESLEEFWESECPRFGEVGAKGWCNFNPPPPDVLAASPSNAFSQDAVLSGDIDPYLKWSRAESSRDQIGRYPLRSTDPMSDEDPYSTVLFSDIRGYLYNPSARVEETKLLLVYTFLQFLGLYFPGLSAYLEEQSSKTAADAEGCRRQNLDSVWSDTRFRDPSVISTVFFPKQTKPSVFDVSDPTMKRKGKLDDNQKASFGAVKDWRWGVLSPLEGHGTNGEGRMWESVDLGRIDEAFVRHVFEQTSARVLSPRFDESWLAFEAAINLKSAIKLSRRMLQADRDSLHRWMSHARLERIRRKTEEAVKIYQTCLEGTSLIAYSKKDSEKMYWDWAHAVWLSGGAADTIVLRAAEVGRDANMVVSGINILRAKKTLDAWIEGRAGQSEDDRCALLALVNLRALLELLTGDLSRALMVYEKVDPQRFSTSDRDRRSLGESLALASSLMAYYHTVGHHRSPIPPSFLHEHILTLIPLYPQNTILLGIWLESERGQSVWGRVKSVVRDIVLGDGDIFNMGGWLWALWQETVSWTWEVGRVKGFLAKCLDSDRSRMSLSIWHIAIKLEVHLNQVAKAKALLYRAVGDCPWTKEFYLAAFQLPLRPSFTTKELEQWANAIMERKIRIRIGLDEYFVAVTHGSDDENADSDDGQGGGDDELEEVIKERLRLMPY